MYVVDRPKADSSAMVALVTPNGILAIFIGTLVWQLARRSHHRLKRQPLPKYGLFESSLESRTSCGLSLCCCVQSHPIVIRLRVSAWLVNPILTSFINEPTIFC